MYKTIDQIVAQFPVPWVRLSATLEELFSTVNASKSNTFRQDWRDRLYLPWQFFYMDYIQLEDQIINECFVERLQYEWNKVYEFYLIKKSEIQKRIDYCHQHLTMNNGSYSSLESILFDIHHLYHFNRLNYCGFIHLFMLHDQHSGPPIHDTLKRHSYFQRNYFWEEANNALYMLAFEMNRICLFHQSSTLNAYLDHIIQYQSMTKESDNRQPSIDKYWMHPDHVLEFVLLLSSKMTLVEDHSFYPVAKIQVGKVPKRQAFTGTLSTVYLDTPEFNDYHTLLDYINTQLSTAAMSQIISCMENSTHTILEQKVFGNPNQEWIEQRAWIKSKHIQPWLRTQYSLDSLLEKASCQYQKDGHFITNESQKHKIKQAYLHLELESRSKKPVLYVTQRRIVYTSQDCSMFVTIDTDINMMHSQGKEDLLYYKSPLSPDQTIQFPYCVIQVHNQRQSNWLSDVLMQCTGSHMLYPVPGFEVFLHGISVLYPEQVKQKPGWFFDPPPQLYHPNECGKILLGRPSLNVPNINSPRSSHSSNSSSNSSSGSSTKCHDQTFSTISTVVTCFDDDDEKQQEMNTPSASSSIQNSPLLRPTQLRKQSFMRSFDSFCSFDHPTSSRSDPTNCKSCMIFIEHDKSYLEDSDELFQSKNNVEQENVVTFSSFFYQTFWPHYFRSLEKEPLLGPKRRRRWLYQRPSSIDTEAWSRAAILTTTCVIMSFSVSFIVYFLLF